MRKTVLLLIAVGLLSPAAIAVAQPVEGSVTVRLLEAPADRRDDPRAQIYVVDHLNPGDRIDRRFEVSNGSDRDLTLDLYAGAAEVVDGDFVALDDRAENELTSWVTIDPPEVTLAGGESAEASLRIEVPPDAADGERYAVAWVEMPEHDAGGGVSLINRVGLRIYLSVGEGEEPASDFEISALTAARLEDGSPVVEATVENTGGRALDMSGELALANGPGGISAGPFEATLGTTLGVGQVAPVQVVLDPEIPHGPWDARLVLRSGPTEREAGATITFPDSAGASGAPMAVEGEPGRGGGSENALKLLALALLLLVLLALFLVWRRRREDEEPAELPVETVQG